MPVKRPQPGDLEAIETASRDEISALQLRRMQATLLRAYTHVPHYRAAIAGKAAKEARYHLQHAGDWVMRLGGGTVQSQQKMQAALAQLWRYHNELFVSDAVDAQAKASGLGPDWSSLQAPWHDQMVGLFSEAGLVVGFALPPHLREVFGFIAGQYLTLRTTLNGQEVRRSYSICAGVDDAQLRVAVRRVERGVFSNWIHQSLKVGDAIDVMAPQGRFYVALTPSAQRHHVAIAGGSGITPILSIMKTVLAREPLSRFTLIYSNRRPASAMFKEEIEDLKNRYMTRLALHHVFTQQQVDAQMAQMVSDLLLGGLTQVQPPPTQSISATPRERR